ncbi:hypothetical protein [Streptacidiphilus sp. MAP5-3]|uniref:hypothetical protein n=1 Tax=unclassified Streptacidiphilus TaxID=2643834 RepID=UPI003514BEDD
MSMSRHTVNRRRRLAAREERGTAVATSTMATTATLDRPERARPRTSATAAPTPRRRLRLPLPVLFAVLTVLLGAFAAWSGTQAAADRAGADADNTALTDTGRTSQVTGSVSQAVNQLFSYSWTDPTRTDQAAHTLLTGSAVHQYATLMATVRAQGPREKLVLSTTVTDCGVDVLAGNRAHVLVYADQTSVSTAAGASNGASNDGAAMLAVDAILQNGTWRIADFDTLGA